MLQLCLKTEENSLFKIFIELHILIASFFALQMRVVKTVGLSLVSKPIKFGPQKIVIGKPCVLRRRNWFIDIRSVN